MCHTESPVGGMCGVMSPQMSYTGGIKMVAPLSWGVLLPLHKMENSTPPASLSPTVSSPLGPSGHLSGFEINYYVLVIPCIAITVPVNLFSRIALHWNPIPVSAR